MSYPVLGECDCKCHGSVKKIIHGKPCCHKCPVCEKYIKSGLYHKKHLEAHEIERKSRLASRTQ